MKEAEKGVASNNAHCEEDGSSGTAATANEKPKPHFLKSDNLLSDILRRSKPHQVGGYEAIRMRDLEAAATHPEDTHSIEKLIELTGTAAEQLLDVCCESIAAVRGSLDELNSARLRHLLGFPHLLRTKRTAESANLHGLLDQLREALIDFRDTKRKAVLAPYEQYLQAALERDDGIPSRGLFYSLLYHFQLIQYVGSVEKLLETTIELTANRKTSLHIPRILKIKDLIAPRRSNPTQPEDEDPEELENAPLLETAEARNPDARSPKSPMHWIMTAASGFSRSLTSGNLFFGVKVGIITVLISLPQYFRPTAHFYYYERGLWVRDFLANLFSSQINPGGRLSSCTILKHG